MAKFNADTMIGLTKPDNRKLKKCVKNAVELFMGMFGSVSDNSGNHIANAKYVGHGKGLTFNTRGGYRPGAGGKPSDVKKVVIKAYPTSDHAYLIKAEADRLSLSVSQYLVNCALANIGK